MGVTKDPFWVLQRRTKAECDGLCELPQFGEGGHAGNFQLMRDDRPQKLARFVKTPPVGLTRGNVYPSSIFWLRISVRPILST